MDFHWNGDQLIDEIPVGSDGKPDDENAIRWIYEPGSFTPLARYEKGQLHYAVTDTVGRLQELLTEDGTIVWRGKQQLWGREESANDANVSCKLRFPGQYEDEESGLYYNRFRYYDCETGHYISADPIGLAGGTNPYGYVLNPLDWKDPLGLAGCNAQFQSRKAALRAAKRDAGIPMHQHPAAVKKIQLTDRDGHAIKDSDFNILESREYHYTRPDGSRVVIQEHSAGHTYGPPDTPGNQGPHFNPRPFDPKTGNGSRNGSLSGSYDHYEYPKGL
jgi:RHS repeat-associated protein